MRLSRAALFLLAGLAVGQLLYYYPAMPETMASHFDSAGRPNGFQSRDGFYALTVAMLSMVVVLFGGFRFLFRVLPASAINVPNREHWLAPERFEETIDFMVRQMEWMGVATLLLLIVVLQGVFEANQSPQPGLGGGIWWVMGGYFLFTAVWLVRFLGRFRKPQSLTAMS
jgi:uncharacterized membrane protein